MAPSPAEHTNNSSNLCGKLTTHDPDTYIVLCLHCLHYFRSLTDLLRHRLMNHNILDPVPMGANLPRVSKDGSWIVAGGDSEPPAPSVAPPPVPPAFASGVRTPSTGGIPTPSPPPLHIPQLRSLGPHHQLQNQFPRQPFPNGPYRPQNPYQGLLHTGSMQRSPAPSSPAPQFRPPQTGPSTTTFSPAAREFIPSGMAARGSATATREVQQAAEGQQRYGNQVGYPPMQV